MKGVCEGESQLRSCNVVVFWGRRRSSSLENGCLGACDTFPAIVLGVVGGWLRGFGGQGSCDEDDLYSG